MTRSSLIGVYVRVVLALAAVAGGWAMVDAYRADDREYRSALRTIHEHGYVIGRSGAMVPAVPYRDTLFGDRGTVWLDGYKIGVAEWAMEHQGRSLPPVPK